MIVEINNIHMKVNSSLLRHRYVGQIFPDRQLATGDFKGRRII